MELLVPISPGQFVDRVTILEIKANHSQNEYVIKELRKLYEIRDQINSYIEGIEWDEMRSINMELWNIEERLREKETLQEFDEEFIELARSVYITNDKRAQLKAQIDERSGSKYRDVKIYS
jgi:hypothetical protein